MKQDLHFVQLADWMNIKSERRKARWNMNSNSNKTSEKRELTLRKLAIEKQSQLFNEPFNRHKLSSLFPSD
jgi:hypothetical protein